MTTTLSDGKRIKLHFRYGVDKRKRRTTTVEIYYLSVLGERDWLPLMSATAACSTKDHFVRATGRQEALKALYRRYRLPESDWKAIQAAYNNRTLKSTVARAEAVLAKLFREGQKQAHS